MAIIIKTPDQIEKMRRAGHILGELLNILVESAKPGISTKELDNFAEKFIKEKGGQPAFKSYRGYPATICTAIDEVVVHGIPKESQILKNGDLLTIDSGVIYQGFYSDAARSVGIGQISAQKQKLISTAKIALSKAIDMAKPGVHLGEISKVIQKIIESAGFHVIHDLTGHGIGTALHEEPHVLNYYDGHPGPILKAGMTLAIEPIFAIGTSEIITRQDNWTIQTKDGSCAVQQENTILITEYGNEILTEQT
ncbi:type I methionyl aminopeptidase [Candidatus Peregrinibacteria bacterium]|nr:type I methionyl aminopeptidase [Candidatus Peregrinibacteria bacterium]